MEGRATRGVLEGRPEMALCVCVPAEDRVESGTPRYANRNV